MNSPEITAGLARWHACVAGSNMTALSELLADEFVFRSPFLWKPKTGKAIGQIVLTAAAAVFEDFVYHREMTDGTSWTLEFSAHIGDVQIKGVDLIKFNEAGQIVEFEVMIRPARGLQTLAEAMVKQMTAQGVYEQFSQA